LACSGWTIVAQPWAACAFGVAATPTCELRADGAFELAGLEGCEHRLRLHDAKGKLRAEFTPSRPPTAAGVACNILIDRPRGKLELRGVVRNSNGEPIPGATLLFESNLRGADGVLRLLSDDDAFARSDDRGRYEIKLPRTPEHEISVYTKTGAPAALRERLLDDGSDEREHDLVVD